MISYRKFSVDHESKVRLFIFGPVFGNLSSSRQAFPSSKKLKKHSGLSVHQKESFLKVCDLKFENCQNKEHPTK